MNHLWREELRILLFHHSSIAFNYIDYRSVDA